MGRAHGESGAGKTALVDAKADCRSQQLNDSPSYTDDPLLKLHLGPGRDSRAGAGAAVRQHHRGETGPCRTCGNRCAEPVLRWR